MRVRFNIYILFWVVLFPVLLSACIEDGYTTSSSDLLEFSTDTLSFDTTFTETGTPTKTFKVYNRHSKMIQISSVKLAGGDEGQFYLNVDGMSGSEFSSVDIRGNDSIYIFVEAYVDTNNDNNPIKIEDKIEFITNGVTQYVVVDAWGQDVIRLDGELIDSDRVLTAQKPYWIHDTLTVEHNVTLTIEAGATLYFHDKAAMRVDGTLTAIGTADAPITMRGDRLDQVVGDISYDIMSGQWGGIDISADSYGNSMHYVSMRGSTTGLVVDSCNVEQLKLDLFNSVLHNSSGSVLTVSHAWVVADGCEFSDAANSVVDLTGGKYSFTQSTFANNYLFSAVSDCIININYIYLEEFTTAPLMSATFDNSIIYGIASDINNGDLTGTDIYIRSTLLRSDGSDDGNFINCVWGADPKFYTVRDEYYFDYRLQNESDAIAQGDLSLLPERCSTDMYGTVRNSGNGIDLGAYAWVLSTDDLELP
ncbi:MAG: hypothetical protein R3Y22_01140 [Bacteroidales bacterium]